MTNKERVPVTQDGLKSLHDELDHLINNERPRVVEAIAEARSHGDLRENAAYDAAKHDQSIIEGRIRELQSMLKRVELIDEGAHQGNDNVQIGSTVTIEIDGLEETYTIVGAVEAKPSQGRVSNESPFGKALLGASPGDEVVIKTPNAELPARVVRIE